MNRIQHDRANDDVKRRAWLILATVAGLTATAAGAWFGTRVNSSERRTKLVVADEELDFGTVWEQTDFRWTVSIHNAASNVVNIRRFVTSCQCTNIIPPSLTIPPRESRNCTVVLDLSPSDAPNDPAQLREFAVHIAADIGTSPGTIPTWRLHGNIRRAYQFAPRSVDFGDTLVEGAKWTTTEVIVTPEIALSSFVAQIDKSELATVYIENDETNNYRLKIAPTEALAVGRYTFSLSLHSITASGDRLPEVEIPVKMRVLDDLQWVPAQVAFGSLELGTAATESAVLQSRTGRAFHVLGVHQLSNVGLDVEFSSIPNGAVVFQLNQRALNEKLQSHTLNVGVQKERSNSASQLTLPISYFGIRNQFD